MEETEANRLESLLLNLIFAAVSAVLLGLLFVATKQGSANAGWWTRPALAPGVALALLLLANFLSLFRALSELRAAPATAEEWADARAKVMGWLRPFEFLAYFAAYLWAIHGIGYVGATLAFVLWLLFRVGLRTPAWLLVGVALVAALVLIFRIGLGVWMPAPPLYDLFPEGVREILIRWF
ncbi:MAG: tripartite tricarboxylate transporter TctB family protein [Albidovulum sp.]